MELFKVWFLLHIGGNPVIQGLIGGIVIIFLHTFGALIVLFVPTVKDKFLDVTLG